MTMSSVSHPTKSPSLARRSFKAVMYLRKDIRDSVSRTASRRPHSILIQRSGAAALCSCSRRNSSITGIGAAPYDPGNLKVSTQQWLDEQGPTVVDIVPAVLE